MSLIECWECGGQVSDHAVLCPHCGAPQGRAAPPRKSGWRWMRRFLFLMGLVAVVVVIARRKGWIDDEVTQSLNAGLPSPVKTMLSQTADCLTRNGDRSSELMMAVRSS